MTVAKHEYCPEILIEFLEQLLRATENENPPISLFGPMFSEWRNEPESFDSDVVQK